MITTNRLCPPPAVPVQTQATAPGATPDDVYVPGEVLLKSRGSSAALTTDSLRALGIASMRRLPVPVGMRAAVGGDIFHARLLPGVGVSEAVQRLQADGAVQWAEPNFVVRALDASPAPLTRVPNDLDSRLWGLRNDGHPGADIGTVEAWATTVGRRVEEGGPLVAILDTGADLTHPDLQANLYTNPGEVPGDGLDNDGNGVVDDVHGHDFSAGEADPVDRRGHGTHVAGTIGAVGDNGQGVVGVAWKTSLMPLKFLGDSGIGDTAAAIDALLYAERMGVRVTSNSWGGSNYSRALHEVLANSHALHVCAAGNDGSDNDAAPVYPAAYDVDNVVSVAATDARDTLASFSNWGARTVDIAAPGDGIFSTIPGGYDTKRGTSMAAPHVTGALALLLAENPTLTNAELKARLLDSADPLPALEGRVASGRLDVARMLSRDAVAPDAPSGLCAVESAPDHVTLQWTASGDDGNDGSASRYVLRWREGDGPEREALGLPRPSPAGAAQAFRLPLLPSATPRTLQIALEARDEAGNAATATAQVDVPGGSVWFRDDFVSGLGQWTAQGPWVIERDHGRVGVTDSLNGDYAPRTDVWLASRDIDLTAAVQPQLVFDGRWTVEKKFDSLAVEVSTDGGQTFRVLERLDGQTPWETHRVDLSSAAGEKARVRFHLMSDSDIEMDGLHLANVQVVEAQRKPSSS